MATMGFIQKTTQLSSRLQNNLVPINFTHAHAIGQTGCGKTTSFIYPNLDHRIEQGHSVLLYDFKGKEHMSLKYFAQKHGRLSDVIEIGKPWGAKINLIRLFNRSDFETYIENTNGHSKDNSYWSKTSVAIASSLYDVVYTLEKFVNILSKSKLNQANIMDTLRKYPHDLSLSFATLYDICQSAKSLSEYMTHVEKVSSGLHECMPKILKSKDEKNISSYELIKVTYAFNEFVETATRLRRTLSEFTDYDKGRSSTTFQSIVLSLSLPLANIASCKELNEDSVDIIDELNKNALVSIDVQMMSGTMLTSLNYALFSQFTQRKMMMQTQPISVFIDEAQRVLSADDDVPIDIFRECKVELILSYQNEDLMIKKLGNNNYESLRKNLSYTALYTNPDNEEVKTSELKVFEFYSNQDNYQDKKQGQSSFIDENELYAAECLYQNKVLNLSDEYVLEKTLTDQVFIFNSRQYAKNIMQLVNFKSLQTDTVEFMLKADYDRAVRTVQNFTNERLEGLEDSQKIEPMNFTTIQNNNMDKILDYIEEVYNATA